MPPCKNNPKRSYKGTEPSPKGLGYCASGEKVGTIKKGKDKKKWIIKEIKNKVKRWVKLNKKISDNNKKLNCNKFVRYQKKEKTFFGTTITTKLMGIQERKGFLRKYISPNTFEETETKIPKDYSKKKITKKFINNYYCNNKKKVLEKDNKEFKKIEKKLKGYKYYFTHDNGGRPFLVYVKGKKVSIYKMPNNYLFDWKKMHNSNKNRWAYITFVKEYKVNKVFIGKDNDSEVNSILLEVKKNKYIIISNIIATFSTNDKIVTYYSPIWGSDVSYPYAISKNHIYFLRGGDFRYLSSSDTDINMIQSDAYSYFYGHKGKQPLEKYSKKIKSVTFIHKRI